MRGKQDDKERQLQDEYHAQENIFLIELQQQYIDAVGIEACACTMTTTEQSVEPAADVAIEGCKQGDTTIAEVDVEGLEDGVHIRGYRHEDKLLELVFFRQLAEGHRRREGIHGEEVEQRLFLLILTTRSSASQIEDVEQYDDQGTEGQDGTLADDPLLKEYEHRADEDKEDQTLLHDSQRIHQTGDAQHDDLPQGNLRVSPQSHDKQCLIDDGRIVQDALSFAIDGWSSGLLCRTSSRSGTRDRHRAA